MSRRHNLYYLMKKFKLLCVAAAMALSAPAIHADEPVYRAIQINYNDGSRFLVNLPESDRKEARLLDAKTLTIGVEKYNEERGYNVWESEVEIDYNDFKSIELTEEASSVNAINADVMIDFKYQNNVVALRNVTKPLMVSVYNADGVMIVSQEITGDFDIDLSGRPGGVYLLNINGKTFKLMVR